MVSSKSRSSEIVCASFMVHSMDFHVFRLWCLITAGLLEQDVDIYMDWIMSDLAVLDLGFGYFWLGLVSHVWSVPNLS